MLLKFYNLISYYIQVNYYYFPQLVQICWKKIILSTFFPFTQMKNFNEEQISAKNILLLKWLLDFDVLYLNQLNISIIKAFC